MRHATHPRHWSRRSPPRRIRPPPSPPPSGSNVTPATGLTYADIQPIAALPEVRELNIGHYLIGEASPKPSNTLTSRRPPSGANFLTSQSLIRYVGVLWLLLWLISMQEPFSALTPLIQVYDMPKSVDFYTSKLGFEVVAASPEVDTLEGRFSHWTLLRSGAIDLMLNTAYDSGERPASPEPARLMAHRDTSFYIACSDLESVYAKLKQAGLDIEPPSKAAYGLRRFSIFDPDNFELVFQERH